VIHENRVLITLHIERSLAATRDRLTALRWQLGLGGFLLTLALGWTLWRILVRLGLRPLQHEIGRRLAVENELRVHRNLLDEEVRQRTIELEQTVQALRASEAALTQKRADLQATNLELQQLIHVIAHDLKGPLRAVSHLTTALEDECGDTLPADARPLLPKLRKRVQRMHALIEALLAYSRAGRAGVVRRVDANAMVQEVIDSFSVPAGFTFTVQPLPTLLTDTLHLRQVFANLIDNAIKHHDRRDGNVRISARDLGDGGYEFAVSDDGPGVPEQYREQVFELFQTLQARDRQEHTGMGLTLVRKIVATRGGTVSVEARTPRGTTVRFTWPAEAAMADNGSH
jgi:signal transduction histidine kinase